MSSIFSSPPASHPDAALIAASAEYAAAEAAYDAVCGRANTLAEERANEPRAKAALARLENLVRRLEATRATTSVGVHAKVLAFIAHDRKMAHDWGADGTLSKRLLVSLWRDAEAVPLPPSQVTANPALADNPDAELIAACENLPVAWNAYKASVEAAPDSPEGPLWDAWMEARDTIHDTSASTIAGVIAKARAAHFEARNTASGEEDPDQNFAGHWSYGVVRDMLRLLAVDSPRNAQKED